MSKPRRRFTAEFKQEAVTLLRRSTKSQTQVAQELGIAQIRLSRWALQADRMPLGARGFFATEELKVLGREMEHLRQERDILKKKRSHSLPRSHHEISVHPGRECAPSSPGPDRTDASMRVTGLSEIEATKVADYLVGRYRGADLLGRIQQVFGKLIPPSPGRKHIVAAFVMGICSAFALLLTFHGLRRLFSYWKLLRWNK